MEINEFVLRHELVIRLGFFFGVFAGIAGWEFMKPRRALTIGIHQYRTVKQVSWLPGMLLLPFIGKLTGYAINRREWNEDHER